MCMYKKFPIFILKQKSAIYNCPALNWLYQFLRVFEIIADNLYVLDSGFVCGIILPFLQLW